MWCQKFWKCSKCASCSCIALKRFLHINIKKDQLFFISINILSVLCESHKNKGTFWKFVKIRKYLWLQMLNKETQFKYCAVHIHSALTGELQCKINKNWDIQIACSFLFYTKLTMYIFVLLQNHLWKFFWIKKITDKFHWQQKNLTWCFLIMTYDTKSNL